MRYIISFLLTSAAALPALAEVPDVVTDIPPVHSLAAAVMGDLGSPVLLLDRGASPHGFQLRPSQMEAVAGADLVLWVGPQLSPWLEKALTARPGGADALALLDAPGTYRQDFAAQGDDGHDHAEGEGHDDHDHAHAEEEGHDHDADHDHDHADDHDHDDHGHSHTGLDPHAWLDPGNGRLWTQLIAAELSRLDPENAATYAANAEAALAAIDAADTQAAALLAPVEDRPFIAFHDAYGYFTAHYGLTMAGTVSAGDAATPGARHLAELREAGAACLFPEAQHDPALITQLAEATGAKVGGALDPEGSTLEPGPALYPRMIVTLAETIAACGP